VKLRARRLPEKDGKPVRVVFQGPPRLPEKKKTNDE